MANKNLTLALKIKADLNQAIKQLDQFERELSSTDKAANKTANSSRSAATGVDVLGRSIKGNTTLTGSYTNALKTADKASQKLDSSNKQVGGGLTSLASSIKAVTLTLAAGFGFAEIIRSTDAWTAYQNRLRLVTGTQSELTSASQDVYEIARNTSQQLDGTAAIYQRFAQNADRLNITLKDSAELTDTVSKAIAISGGSAESSAAAVVQFSQGLASGVLRGEEFNSVMEQAPGLALALASGLDVDIGKLREMANAGELTADVLVDALSRAKDSVDEQFASRVRTISQAATEFDVAFTRIVGTISTGQGAGVGLANMIGGLADLIDSLADNADILGAALDAALVLTAGKALSSLTNLTAEGLKNIAMQKAATAATAQKALTVEASAAASQKAALAEVGNTTASLRSAEAEVAVTAAEVRRTSALAANSTLLSGKAGLEAAAASAVNAHTAAEARLVAAQEARAAANVAAMVTTTNLTRATTASAIAIGAAATASSVLTRTIVTLTAVGGRLLSFLGGPVGIVISLALAATAFLDFGGDAESGMETAANATESASVRVRNATRDMIKSLNLGDLSSASYDQLSQGLDTLQEQLKAAVDERDRLQTLEDQDVVFGVTGNLEEAQEKVRSLESAVRKLQQIQSGEQFEGVRAGDKYLENLDRQRDRIENVTETEKALAFLRSEGIEQSSEMGQQILSEAAANDVLIESKRKEQKAEMKLQSVKDESKRQIKARISEQKKYVEQLERSVEVYGLSTEQTREYELAEKGLSGALLERARAANAALATQEKLNQAMEDAQELERIQIRLLENSGKSAEARALELEQEFGDLLKRLRADGNTDGANLIESLIDVELARARLDEVQAEIDTVFDKQNREEQSIQTELDAGLIDELDARERLLKLHSETAAVLEQQKPILEALANQPGAVGEAAQAAYQQLNDQIKQLHSTSTLLESTLKEGLQGGIQTAVQGLADGTMTLRDAIGSLVQSVANAMTELLAKMIAQKAVLSMFGDSAGSSSGFLGGLFGYADGGWTGPGSKYQVAGVVHAGEFVQPSDVMQQPGALPFMESFRRHGMQALNAFQGYAEGGLVGSEQMLQPAPMAASGGATELNIFNSLDAGDMAQQIMGTTQGSRSIVNTIRSEKSQIKAILEG
jgi:tape measure domain-containing protein